MCIVTVKIKEEIMVILQWLAENINKVIKLNSLILFGSYARGEERHESDIDLLIVSENFPDKFSERFDILRPIFNEAKSHPAYKRIRKKGYYLQFSPLPYRPEELDDTPPLLLDLTEDSLIIKDDGTFARKINELKRKLKSLGAERRITKKGNRYWILKPGLKRGEIIEL